MERTDDPIITVRRQWNDWQEAQYRLSDIRNLHWSNISGGVNAVAPRAFIHGYVMCNGMIDGGVAHSCRHGPPPHEILVCIVKKANKDVFAMIMDKLEKDTAQRARRGFSSPK